MSKKLHALSWALCTVVGFAVPAVMWTLYFVLHGISEAWVVLVPSAVILAVAILVMALLARRSRLAGKVSARIAIAMSIVVITVNILCRVLP